MHHRPSLEEPLAGEEVLMRELAGSVMAGLVNGCATVTTTGSLTETLWKDEGGVAMALAGDPAALVDVVAALLTDDARRAALGRAGYRLYDTRFAVRHAVRHLTDQPGNPVPSPATR